MELFYENLLLLAIKSKLPPFPAGISSYPKVKVQPLNLGFTKNVFLCTKKKSKRKKERECGNFTVALCQILFQIIAGDVASGPCTKLHKD